MSRISNAALGAALAGLCLLLPLPRFGPTHGRHPPSYARLVARDLVVYATSRDGASAKVSCSRMRGCAVRTAETAGRAARVRRYAFHALDWLADDGAPSMASMAATASFRGAPARPVGDPGQGAVAFRSCTPVVPGGTARAEVPVVFMSSSSGSTSTFVTGPNAWSLCGDAGIVVSGVWASSAATGSWSVQTIGGYPQAVAGAGR